MSEFTYELPPDKDFYKTLVEYIDHKGHSDINEILKTASMSFKPTSDFTQKLWNTYWCSIIFYVPVNELAEIKQEWINVIKKYCTDLLPPDCGFLIDEIKFAPLISNTKEDTAPELKVIFEQQKQKIIQEISEAKFVIWIAVAWFTLDEIYQLLVRKSQEGLDIRIIVSKDEINREMYDKYTGQLNIIGYPKFGKFNNNLMHNKFCVIDLKKVIHGSYNWSKKADYNKETVEIVDDRKTAEEFSEQFKILYVDIKKGG